MKQIPGGHMLVFLRARFTYVFLLFRSGRMEAQP